MSDFDVEKALEPSVKKITAALGDYTLPQVEEMLAAEKAKDEPAKRTTLIPLLEAEIEMRKADQQAQAFVDQHFSEEAIEHIAAQAHELNAHYCGMLGDFSQELWPDAPDWQKSSIIAGVTFLLAHPDASLEASHERWMERKLADGWTYGEAKDTEAKTHPCLVPFDELPVEQRVKDMLFKRTVHMLAPLVSKAEEAVPAHDSEAASALGIGEEASALGIGEEAPGEPAPPPERPVAEIVARARSIAFFDEPGEGGREQFRREVRPIDFKAHGRLARYSKPVDITSGMGKVSIKMALLLDGQGTILGIARWPVALTGGGGRKAQFPAGHIAFNL